MELVVEKAPKLIILPGRLPAASLTVPLDSVLNAWGTFKLFFLPEAVQGSGGAFPSTCGVKGSKGRNKEIEVPGLTPVLLNRMTLHDSPLVLIQLVHSSH